MPWYPYASHPQGAVTPSALDFAPKTASRTSFEMHAHEVHAHEVDAQDPCPRCTPVRYTPTRHTSINVRWLAKKGAMISKRRVRYTAAPQNHSGFSLSSNLDRIISGLA